MRYSLFIVSLCLVLASVANGAVVQRRYRNAQEILVPVTVIQDGEPIPEIQKPLAEEKSAEKEISQVIEQQQQLQDEEEQKPLEVAAIAVEAQRRIDDDILEEEIKEVVEEENQELLKAIQEKEILIEEKEKEDTKTQEPKPVQTEEIILLSDVVPNAEDQAIKTEQTADQLKSVKDETISADEIAIPLVAEDLKDETQEIADGILRQATQATPAQPTTQQGFVQQFIQNSPLGQFFSQISGQTTQGQVASDDAPATPAPTIPGFLAPAITAAQNVVNTTTNAFQGLQQFASNLGNQFQNTLSGLTGQQPVQQTTGEATTARPAGPFQQLVNTFMGNNNNNNQQGTPAPQQQGPLQGLLNIFQGNNNRPQTNNAAPANIVQQPAVETAEPAKQPEEVVEQTNDATEGAENEIATNEISNDVRSSAEADDSFEEAVHPDEMIVVQDDASQSHSYSDQL